MPSTPRGMWLPRRFLQGLLPCILALSLAAMPGRTLADAQPVTDPFQQLDEVASDIYRDAKDRFHAAAGPVVIVGFEDVMIRPRGQTRRVGHIPPAYQILKAGGHTPRTIWAALRPAMEGLDTDAAWRGKLEGLRPHIQAARAALPGAGLSPKATARDQRLLDASLGLIDVYLSLGLPDRARLEADMRALAPLILADAAEAARLQLAAIDTEVRPW